MIESHNNQRAIQVHAEDQRMKIRWCKQDEHSNNTQSIKAEQRLK